MMYTRLCIATILLLTLHADAEDSSTFELRDASNEVCERFFNLATKAIVDLKAIQVERFNIVQHYSLLLFKVDISKPEELKAFICKVVDMKTLRDLYGIGLNEHWFPYERLVDYYELLEDFLGGVGGFTNMPRIVQLFKDLLSWGKTLNLGASTPKEATSLSNITHLFEVQQVKYGSRWISLPANSGNQMVMIEDPVTTAKELYESSSASEVKDILGLDEFDQARTIYIQLLMNRGGYRVIPTSMFPPNGLSIDQNNIHILEVVATTIYGLGELGLFTLEY